MSRMDRFDVCVVGAGPVGLTLALDLAKRSIRVALIDKELEAGPWPKMERCNARSMEIYRRLRTLHDEFFAMRAGPAVPESDFDDGENTPGLTTWEEW